MQHTDSASCGCGAAAVYCRHAELHDDTWRGAIPWRVLYPTKALPVHASPHCSAAPSSDQTTNHKDAASSAGTTPTYMETDHEIQYKGEDLQYNPMLVDLIRYAALAAIDHRAVARVRLV